MHREQNGQTQTDVDNGQCNGHSQTSMEVTSNVAPDEMMEDHQVDTGKEVSSMQAFPGKLHYQS